MADARIKRRANTAALAWRRRVHAPLTNVPVYSVIKISLR